MCKSLNATVDMSVFSVALPKKEHDSARVVQLVHLVEIWHFRDVHKVNDGKVLHLSRQKCKWYIKNINYS